MKKIIVANWKSNKSVSSVQSWFAEFTKELKDISLDSISIIIAPAAPLIPTVLAELQKLPTAMKPAFSLALQDISPFPAGSYTGAISGENVKELGVTHAIVGHSERRRYFHETSGDVSVKIEQALQYEMSPIICVDDRNHTEQMGLLSPEIVKNSLVVYEPISAIGTGENADVATVTKIKEHLEDFVKTDLTFLYGGSVTAENVTEYLLVCDGVLVGTSALDAHAFAEVVAIAVRDL